MFDIPYSMDIMYLAFGFAATILPLCLVVAVATTDFGGPKDSGQDLETGMFHRHRTGSRHSLPDELSGDLLSIP